MKLTKRQHQGNELLATEAVHNFLYGGSRSGKTVLFVRAIALRASAAAGSRHAILRFRFNHCKTSIMLDTFPKVMELCFPNIEYRVDKSDYFAILPNKSEIWFGGLDEKERTEKILGKEFVTIFLNECSQIPWSSRNLALTRLAQKVEYEQFEGGKLTKRAFLRPKMYYDCNPPSKAHWTHKLFINHIDPDTLQPKEDPGNYRSLSMNPADNLENIPDEYIKTLKSLPMRLQKRFLEGKFGDVNDNALWSMEVIDKWRTLTDQPEMQRIIIAVDPSGAGDEENEENDAIGIIVGALGTDGNGYVLEDLTLKAGPATWGKVVTSAFERHNADKVVAEGNYGGAMVGHVIETARRNTPFNLVTATRGKVVRAEPISALHEKGKIRFCGYFPQLEDELLSFTTTGYTGERSPNRADAFIWLMSEIFPNLIRDHNKRFQSSVADTQFNPLGR